MTEVIPNLFVGNWRDAQLNADAMHVITVAHDSPFVGIEHFKLVDGPGNESDVLVRAAEAARAAHLIGKKVLIHCHGGRSRSGAVTVLSIMKILNLSLCDAYDIVANRHEMTRIHPHLSKILLELEL